VRSVCGRETGRDEARGRPAGAGANETGRFSAQGPGAVGLRGRTATDAGIGRLPFTVDPGKVTLRYGLRASALLFVLRITAGRSARTQHVSINFDAPAFT
jgi:hypothetical protein